MTGPTPTEKIAALGALIAAALIVIAVGWVALTAWLLVTP